MILFLSIKMPPVVSCLHYITHKDDIQAVFCLFYTRKAIILLEITEFCLFTADALLWYASKISFSSIEHRSEPCYYRGRKVFNKPVPCFGFGGYTLKVFTIVSGADGAGKSSLIGVLKALRDDLGIIIENSGVQRTREYLDKGVCFTLESSLFGRETELTAMDAKDRGYFIRLFYVGLDSPEECLLRIENRVKRGGHNIPEHDVLRRFAGRWEAVAKILPYCDEAHFFDNNNGFVEVAEYMNGELILKGSHHPNWVLELAEYLGKHNFDA